MNQWLCVCVCLYVEQEIYFNAQTKIQYNVGTWPSSSQWLYIYTSKIIIAIYIPIMMIIVIAILLLSYKIEWRFVCAYSQCVHACVSGVPLHIYTAAKRQELDEKIDGCIKVIESRKKNIC